MTTVARTIPERRIRARLQPVREVWGTKASWQRIEPGPTRARRWAAVVTYGFVAICIATLLGWFFSLLGEATRWEHLRSRGLSTTATVQNAQFRENSDGEHGYYLDARAATCDCVVSVRVTTIEDHPYGSLIPIRYDPLDYSNAVPLVDRPPSHLTIGFVVFFAVFAPCVALAGWWLLRRHRCKTLFRRSTDQRPVTFQAWKRSLGNTHYFLVLHDAGAPERGEPICCVPVPSSCLRRLRADDVLFLIGHGGQPSVALRRERRVILSCGPAKPGHWEQALRDNERV
jgi:hypothetical protein